MTISDDPYFAGRILEKSAPGKGLGPAEKPPVLAWIGVYAVNLIVPVLFGSMVTREGGKVGMLIGIIVVFALGCRVCFVSRRAVLTVAYGGWIVAVSQCFPILQIIAGLIGVAAAGGTNHEFGNGNVDTLLGGFIATLLTGCILIAVATALGAVIQWIISSYSRGRIFGVNAGAGEI